MALCPGTKAASLVPGHAYLSHHALLISWALSGNCAPSQSTNKHSQLILHPEMHIEAAMF